MGHQRTLLVVIFLCAFIRGRLGVLQAPCSFNPLCVCVEDQDLMRDVQCIGVPFSTFPVDIGDCENGQVTLAKSGLEVLQNDSLAGTRLSTLRLMHNSLSRIFPCAFCGAEDHLVSLDLSHNLLRTPPLHQLRKLRHLQWLNLQGNLVEDVRRGDWEHFSESVALRSLFLGGNRISFLRDRALWNLSHLTVLELDKNLIREIVGQPFPSKLTRLNLANNLLEEVPRNALRHLASLSELFLGGNRLKTVPSSWFLPVRQLDKLDLSRNLMDRLPEKLFNGSVYIQDLHLEFNFLTQLPEGLFRSVSVRRLSLANNRLSVIPDHALGGLESVLLVLDLSFNLFQDFPPAVRALTSLATLYLRGNSLRSLSPADLNSFRATLGVLDLSGNKFVGVPRSALRKTLRLSRLSLQDNLIEVLWPDDFAGWGENLTTLSLANNGIRILSRNTFVHLRDLRELKLSFNSIHFVDYQVFLPLKATLEVLELSSSLGQRFFPLELIRHMKRVRWLQLDHNQMENLTDSYLQGLPSLNHFDLEGNRIGHITPGFFKDKIHQRLNRIVLAHNELTAIQTSTFRNLTGLHNVVLLGNHIEVLKRASFKDLPRLHSVVLSRNRIKEIEASAFQNLPSLSNLLMQHNNLTTFSLNIFNNVSSKRSPLYVNVSHNALVRLESFEGYVDANESASFPLRTLDVSYNRLSDIEAGFLATVGQHLSTLSITNNNFEILDDILVELNNLQALQADHNFVSNLTLETFEGTPRIQAIGLGHNTISRIDDYVFANLTRLRTLDLSHNLISHISETAFEDTALERLNLSHNRLSTPCTAALLPTQRTLRALDIAGNRLSELSERTFEYLHNLLALNLSTNRIVFVDDDALRGLEKLLHLDLSGNPLFRLNEIAFHALKSLETLSLKNCSLGRLPVLPMKRLVELNVAENFLFNVSSDAFVHLRSLRRLDVSKNLLEEVPKHLWECVPFLRSLDLSNNPIEFLSVDSFSGVRRLQELDIRYLQLKFLDSRTLHGLKMLTTFLTTTYAGVRSFRLQELLSHCSALKKVSVEVEETVLSYQLQWAFNGAKISELTVTGRKLRAVFPDALLGLHRVHELVLRLTGTSISRLPAGLLRYLADVRYLTLDLRKNLLQTMGPEVLRPARDEPGIWRGTQHLAGGIRLEGNPWICDCRLLWLSQWLRRWLRETLRVQTLHFDAAIYVHNLARQSECTVPGTQTRMPIIDLEGDDLGCTSGSSRSAIHIGASIAAWATLVVWLLENG
ncbi:chaoptin-like [Ornithodoros turicata]|uniref:chaoptin-like n=1 Tax=Ornithodoros turicata TaxID=34597 RepID=UPI003138CD35